MDVAEGGEVVEDPGRRIRDDPFEFVVLGEIQTTDVVTGRSQAGLEPEMEVGEGVQLDLGEQVATTAMNPADGNEGTREKTGGVPNEHIDDLLDDLQGEIRYGHFEGGEDGRGV